MKKLSLAAAVAAALVAGHAHAAAYIVQARGANFDAKLERKVESLGAKVVARYPQIGVAIVEADTRFDARATALPEVQSATRDRTLQFDVPEAVPAGRVTAMAEPPNSGDDDFLYDLQWGFDAMNVQAAWAKGFRGAGARVAVLDSGLDCTHPDLAPNNLAALNASFVPGETACEVQPYPAFNHGTHVAGTIAAADNGIGVIGVAPESKFFAVKVLSAYTGSGSFAGILEGIMYAVEKDADVINMSLGVRGGLPVGRDTRELVGAVQRAVLHAKRENTIVIAAAGNDGTDYDTATAPDGGRLMAFPAGVTGVVAIAANAPLGWALNPAAADLDRSASYTNYGRRLIDLSAPGGDSEYLGNEACNVAGYGLPCWLFDMVVSTSTGGWSFSAGTSMAAPHAAGVAALVVGAAGGELHANRIENALRRGADDVGAPGFDPMHGHGRVDAGDSVDKVRTR
ncbi:S8 family serine peptidase [Cognatilysobacter bugurensis]|uniref:Peptidase S8 n=1 Tax=Cognatilysobacter bugurensis TaxID=543356 RepID=A0A918T071_9GAMM|nr:S8 family serine peptidase [Lysobacter bugurensis]GHA80961.1 peptidase S8 [Lysobacter bugurensis]